MNISASGMPNPGFGCRPNAAQSPPVLFQDSVNVIKGAAMRQESEKTASASSTTVPVIGDDEAAVTAAVAMQITSREVLETLQNFGIAVKRSQAVQVRVNNEYVLFFAALPLCLRV